MYSGCLHWNFALILTGLNFKSFPLFICIKLVLVSEEKLEKKI